MKINKRVRDSINKMILPVTRVYHDRLPLTDLHRALQSHGVQLVQEDGTPFEAIFCGREGRTTIDTATLDGQAFQNCLVFSWYKMESGRYEVNAYLS
jgi:hypothetical protein